MKNLPIIIINLIIWGCCISSIIVRPFSALAANIILGVEIASVVIYITILGIITIINNRKIRKMKREIALMLLSRKLGGKDDIKE